MIFQSVRNAIITVILLAVGSTLALARPCQAQQQQQPAPAPAPTKPGQAAAPQSGTQNPAEAPKVDPEEEKAYKAFYDANTPAQADARIKLGEDFVAKYPKSKYAEVVYARLMQDYFNKQQFDKMYDAAAKTLAINPDNVSVLVLEGWVIPHNYDPNDMNSERLLNRAEADEKHAIELIPNLPKPAGMTDDQFSKAKDAALSQAHSGLGLVDFRKQDFANSVSELQQGEKLATTPDPTDFYVMGIELQALNRFSDASDAFQKCAQIPGALADRCKQKADETKKLAAAKPAGSKP
jgi:tetratricopeptide (TPR) repeat protein